MDILRNCPTLKYENGHYILTQSVNVAIKRHQTIIDVLFTAVVIVLVTSGTLCIGCGLEMEQLVTSFQRPIPLIIGLVCQIIYLPLLSLGISKTFRLDNSTSLGLLSTATSPGMKNITFLTFQFTKYRDSVNESTEISIAPQS
jgi:predicted Na+-dependent transporter